MSWPETTEHINVFFMTQGFRNDLSFLSRPQNFVLPLWSSWYSWQMTISKARQNLKIKSVNQLSVYHTAIEMFNIINNKSSVALHEEMKIQPRGYNLRGLEEGKVQVPEKGKKSCNGFHYMGPKMWNSLPSHIRKTTKRNIFKEKVKDFIWENIPSV